MWSTVGHCGQTEAISFSPSPCLAGPFRGEVLTPTHTVLPASRSLAYFPTTLPSLAIL